MKYINYKPYLDFFISIFLFLILSPLIFFICILILIVIGRPIFFVQQRLGKNKKIFSIIKFRTLKNSTSTNVALDEDDLRSTKLGLFLRKTSLDELPNLINVIKGDMSFIGPRPLLVRYKDGFSNYFDIRHSVKPGITGIAQIKGRTNMSWRNRFRFDVFYVKKISFKLDFFIFTKTIKYLFLLHGFRKNEVKFTKPFV